MKKLSNSLKKMLSGLAYQDAGEYLSINEKMRVLGYGSQNVKKTSNAPRHPGNPISKRIALISDGRGLGAPLSYAIEAAQRQNACIDLLIHGISDAAKITPLEIRIQQAGLQCLRIQLGDSAAEAITDYICNHPSLMFLVAMPDDTAAKVLIEDIIPTRGSRIPVPLVLIEDQPEIRTAKKSAA
ncbi:MAG: hypothetical protein C0631_14065 [Sedimenticola sp.]|nr:MAG: hypothetical protein C0631_14065 [Sedimenticola sp.]